VLEPFPNGTGCKLRTVSGGPPDLPEMSKKWGSLVLLRISSINLHFSCGTSTWKCVKPERMHPSPTSLQGKPASKYSISYEKMQGSPKVFLKTCASWQEIPQCGIIKMVIKYINQWRCR